MPPKDNKEKTQQPSEEQPVTDETKSKKPAGAPKRQKIVKACKDCRRRKVKCDGAMPCGTCRRSSIDCIFESTSPKRGATKHYIESLENRIHVIERALNSLGGPTMQIVEEAVRRQQLVDENGVQEGQQAILPEDRFILNDLGSPGYMTDIQTSMMYSHIHDSQSSNSSPSPKSIHNLSTSREEIEIEHYLNQIQPYFPLFVPNYLNHQYHQHELPRILIYAICALGSHFQQNGEEENYYQKAMILLDESIGRPTIAIVQTLLLLIKYIECKNNAFYFEKIKSLMLRTIEMCKILKLHQQLVINNNSPDPDAETKRRTFCMVFYYNTLICVEQGIESTFSIPSLDAVLPSMEESSSIECLRYMTTFSFTLSQIHQHISRVTSRQNLQNDRRSENQITEENMALLHLQVMIENDLIHLPGHLNYNNTGKLQQYPFPAAEEENNCINVSPMTRLLHMLYHLNVILLHLHYFMYPLPQGANIETTHYPHRQMCISSASIMTRLVEGLLLDQKQSFRYAPGGLQFVIHCITSARTVLHTETLLAKDVNSSKVYFDEHQRCAQLVQQFSSISPSNELRLLDFDNASSTSPSPILTSLSFNSSPTGLFPSTAADTPIATKQRRNTISDRPYPQRNPSYPIVVPQSLLQSSSTDVNQFSIHHQPLHNIHAAPLHIHQSPMHAATVPPMTGRTLRGSTQSCQDLRSINRLHKSMATSPQQQHFNASFTQHRKPVSSVISSSTVSTAPGPYRNFGTGNNNGSIVSNTSSRNVSPSLPYGKPNYHHSNTNDALIPIVPPHPSQSAGFPRQQQSQSQSQPGKIRRIKKSVSHHGLSNTYQRQQQQMQQQQYQLYQQQQHQQQQQYQFQQQFSQLFYTPSPQPQLTQHHHQPQQQQHQQLHRPYQPSYDDDMKIASDVVADDFSMNVDLNFLSAYPLTTNDDHLGSRSEGHQLL
ncbi:unnamed protein product [Mucor circinelloides]